MKNKIQFIIPKLLVATAMVGIATLLIGTIFKILLVTTILFSIGTLIYSKVQNRRFKSDNPYMMNPYDARPYLTEKTNAIVPVTYVNNTRKATIVPIY